MSKFKKIVIIILVIIIVTVIAFFVYFSNYYHANNNIESYLKSTDIVKVSKIQDGYYFDGYGEDTALIFYPGAKVEAKAYAKLMNKLAQNGVDCFLVEMPLNFAFFGGNRAKSIQEKYEYKNWGISGHSLGGVVASNYAIKNQSKIDFIILFASYPTKQIDNSIKMLSIYGDKDGVLNKDAYNKNKKFWNDECIEYIITGGNHAGFGDYGKQKGDNVANITNDEQQDQTINYIMEFLK